MKKILFIVFAVLFFFGFTEARAPLESYKRYMIVLVHGTGAKTLKPHDYTADSKKSEVEDAPRKSAIWDKSKDDSLDENWQGNIGGSLQSRGFLGHVSWYDFYEPYKSPIYDENRDGFQESLSRYLGDRDNKDQINPMATRCDSYWETKGKRYGSEKSARLSCYKYFTASSGECEDVEGNISDYDCSCEESDGGRTCSVSYTDNDCLAGITEGAQYFGRTAHSYWLHKFFPNDFDENEKVEYHDDRDKSEKANTVCPDKEKEKDKEEEEKLQKNVSYLELAQKDWEAWYKLRNHVQQKDLNKLAADDKVSKIKETEKSIENEKPKKYILIAHSMGGLTTRDYITGKYYKGDVDKLITLDSPHEGAGIANYVQYWHETDPRDGASIFAKIAIPAAVLVSYIVADVADVATKLPSWVTSSAVVLAPVLKNSVLSLAMDKALTGYDDDGVKYGIDVMALDDSESYGLYHPRDFLKTFNNRSSVNDANHNGYNIPYFRLVSTSGVPTPGGDGFHKAYKYPYDDFIGGLEELLYHGWKSENGNFVYFNTVFKNIMAFLGQSMWNDWGSGFVSTWSGQGKNVALFNNGKADVKRWNVSFDDYSGVYPAAPSIVASLAAATTADLILRNLVTDNPATRILRILGYVGVLGASFASTFPFDEFVKYVGYHGGMVRRVDEDAAPSAPSGSDMKLLDELLWEKPSVSLVYEPVDVEKYDYSKGGYVGIRTSNESFEYSNAKDGFKSIDVKWKGEENPHEFDVDLASITDDEERERNKKIFVVGKLAGSKIKSLKLKKVGTEESKDISVSEGNCEVVAGSNILNGSWSVDLDNQGVLSCNTGLSDDAKGSYTLQAEVSHTSEKGGFLIDLGREPGRTFIAEKLESARDTDWDKYLTFKNRRPQEDANKNHDPSVADMVDYHRSSLLTVNKLPRIFDFEVDDLQPDRMRKIELILNNGTASITYSANKDPNQYNETPDGFEDSPKGFVDPSKEKFTITLKQGGITKTYDHLDNPIDAWGKMTVDLDDLQDKLGVEIQPFLEGRNHIRVYSENRWHMNRNQDINIFIPGPPPVVQPIVPMVDDAFCGKRQLIFDVELMYGQSSALEESDLEVSFTNNKQTTVVSGFTIKNVGDSRTRYRVTSNNPIEWPEGETNIVITVKPRINGSLANPIKYSFTIQTDCTRPTIVFDDDQEIYNPSRLAFNVFDQIVADGEHFGVEDLLIELKSKKGGKVDELLFADQFSSPGAKIRNLNWLDDSGNPKYDDGKYELIVSAHDYTIKDDASDVLKKNFWDTYKNGSLPDLSFNAFPGERNQSSGMTQWTQKKLDIVLDFSKPTVQPATFSINADNDRVVYAGSTTQKDLTVFVKASDENASAENPLKASLFMQKTDAQGNPLVEDAQWHFDMDVKSGEDGDFELEKTIINAVDGNVNSFVNLIQEIPDGIYGLWVSVQDASGNVTDKKLAELTIDMTKPRIFDVVVTSPAESGKEHKISFDFDESNDVTYLQDLNSIKTKVSANCGSTPITYKGDSSKRSYVATIPKGVTGSCLATITAEDVRGNISTTQYSFVVDHVPPQIISPRTADVVSGHIAIYGYADDPSLVSGNSFTKYELSYAPIDEDENILAQWSHVGMTVPENKRCANYEYRSCKPTNRYDASPVLGYWNTASLEKNQTYRIKVTTYDETNELDAYVDVVISPEEEIAPQIAFDNLPSIMNFEADGASYNISWIPEVSIGKDSGQVHLEIMRMNDKNEKIVTVVNRTFESIVPNAYYGKPEGSLDKGAYMWISKDEITGSSNKYHLLLSAGNSETEFNVSFYTGNSGSLVIKKNGADASSDAQIMDNYTNLGTVGAIYVKIAAGSSVEYTIETESKNGLYWNLASSLMSFEGANYHNVGKVPLYAKGEMNPVNYVFVGSSKIPLGSTYKNDLIHIPSVIGGGSFKWDGTIDGSMANVPSGRYRVKATLEGLSDNQMASVEEIVNVTGKPVQLKNVSVTPKNVDFSNVLPNITLNFNIDQDALVSVYVRSKNGSAPKDLNEYMTININGVSETLNKLSLAGSKVNYSVNWNGTYGRSQNLVPNDEGYEFVVEVYDVEGDLKQSQTVGFNVVPKNMKEDNNIVVGIDGNTDNTVEYGGLDYILANGMNDAVLEVSPRGTRVVTDEVNLTYGYKGTQSVLVHPYERYSIGVQIHRRSISFHAVLAYSYKCTEEHLWPGKDEPQSINRARYLGQFTFSEDNKNPVAMFYNDDPDTARDDKGGVMNMSNVRLYLIASHKATDNLVKKWVSDVENLSNLTAKNMELDKTIAANADVSFVWGSGSDVFTEGSRDGGLKSSDRFTELNDYLKTSGTVPTNNTTDIYWDLGCDVGTKASSCDDYDPNKSIEPGENGKGNGIADKGEPMRGTTEKYDPEKHQAEMTAYAWAWKNTNGGSGSWDPWGAAGCWSDKCYQHNLMYYFTIQPTERFWANSEGSFDYGWNNLVNRYLTIDPMNTNFLFGNNGAFKENKTPYLNVNHPQAFVLSKPNKKEKYFIDLLHNETFVRHYYNGSLVNFTGELWPDVEMRLHYFKVNPEHRANYPYSFVVGAFRENNAPLFGEQLSYIDESKNATTVSNSISLGSFNANTPLTLAIAMESAEPVQKDGAFAWPVTASNLGNYYNTLCGKNGICGDEMSDAEPVESSISVVDDAHVDENGYYTLTESVAMNRMGDGSSGYNVKRMFEQKVGGAFTSIQGGSKTDITGGNSLVTITEAKLLSMPAAYEIDDGILRKTDCENGCEYDPKNDPLMAKIDDDGDGKIGEDGRIRDEDGDEGVDDDDDLAVDEDPKDAFRTRLSNMTFDFIGGGENNNAIRYNLADLISAKADLQNVKPANSPRTGWSVLLKNGSSWVDNEYLDTKWEDSENPSSFERTFLFYKDGKKHTDVEIVAASGMTSHNAKEAQIYVAPAKFDGRDRRLLEVRARMSWGKNNKYSLYASSDKGWIDLTPEKPLTPLSGATELNGVIAYWDVETSGYHQLLLIREANGQKFYKVFPVAIGAVKSAGDQVFTDALGRAQITMDEPMDFVDVVPLGSDQIPQLIPADGGLGPVVQIYPALKTLGKATFRLRFNRSDVEGKGWDNNAAIYVVSEGYTPQRLDSPEWIFYSADNQQLTNIKSLSDLGWDYAIVTATLSAGTTAADEEIVRTSVGQSIKQTDGSLISVQESAADDYIIDLSLPAVVGE